MLESYKAEGYKTERLEETEVNAYIDFFRANIEVLDVYSEEERAGFIARRTPEYIKTKLADKDCLFIVVKNPAGDILASVEGEIFKDPVTGKQIGLVRWIIVGRNALSEPRLKRMTLGKNLGDVLEREFINRGCEVLRAEIKDGNLVSRNFSVRFGFRPSAIKHKVQDMKWYYKEIKRDSSGRT